MNQTEQAATTSLWLGLWRLADPKVSLAFFASVFLGVCAAAASGQWSAGRLLLVVVPAVHAIEIAKNASGEIFDFDSGADLAVEPQQRSPFSGRKRVLLSLPLGLLINEFPDFDADLSSGKRTLVVRSGRTVSSWIFALTTGLAFLIAAPPPRFGFTRWVWMGGVSAIPGGMEMRNILRHLEDTPRLIRGQALSLATFVSYSAGTGISLLVA